MVLVSMSSPRCSWCKWENGLYFSSVKGGGRRASVVAGEAVKEIRR
jgi:hypothetical protein